MLAPRCRRAPSAAAAAAAAAAAVATAPPCRSGVIKPGGTGYTDSSPASRHESGAYDFTPLTFKLKRREFN